MLMVSKIMVLFLKLFDLFIKEKFSYKIKRLKPKETFPIDFYLLPPDENKKYSFGLNMIYKKN